MILLPLCSSPGSSDNVWDLMQAGIGSIQRYGQSDEPLSEAEAKACPSLLLNRKGL